LLADITNVDEAEIKEIYGAIAGVRLLSFWVSPLRADAVC